MYEFSHNDVSEAPVIVGRVHALDRDAPGPNSRLAYTLSHGSELFKVDREGGAISVVGGLATSQEAEPGSSFRLRVIATDHGSPPRSSECEVRISLSGGHHGMGGLDGPGSRELEERPPVALPRNVKPGTEVANFNDGSAGDTR